MILDVLTISIRERTKKEIQEIEICMFLYIFELVLMQKIIIFQLKMCHIYIEYRFFLHALLSILLPINL